MHHTLFDISAYIKHNLKIRIFKQRCHLFNILRLVIEAFIDVWGFLFLPFQWMMTHGMLSVPTRKKTNKKHVNARDICKERKINVEEIKEERRN